MSRVCVATASRSFARENGGRFTSLRDVDEAPGLIARPLGSVRRVLAQAICARLERWSFRISASVATTLRL